MSGTAFARVVAELRARGRKVWESEPGKARAQCPGHDGQRDSLAVTAIEGSVLLCCHAGCDTGDVLDALGLGMADMFDHSRGAEYGYRDAGGRLTRTVHRTPAKDFRQTGDTRRRPVLYRLPEVLVAVEARATIYVTEGEKDVHALEVVGGVATTAPGGARNFGKVDASPLYGAQVVAVVDQDEAGRRWAADVFALLDGKAASLRFVRAATGKDAADHIAAGHSLDEFVPVEVDTPPATQEPQDAGGWAPVDLGPHLDGSFTSPEPTLLARTDGVSLIYPGLTHSFHGESESGKSLLLQHECARVLMAGGWVLFADFESDAGSVVDRLLWLGATREAVAARLTYLRPEVHPRSTTAARDAFDAVLSREYDLAVVDGVTDALGVFGYATKDNDDISVWARELPRRIAERTGAAVALVDHVTKDGDSRGRFAIGGQAKMSGLTGAAYTVEVAAPLGRGLRGVIVVRVAKDRPGFVRGRSGLMRKSDRTQEAARVTVDSTGSRTVVTVDPPTATDLTGAAGAPAAWRPTALMEKVLRVLEDDPAPLSFRKIKERVHGKEDHIRKAIEVLAAEGFVSVVAGPQRSNLHTVIARYRQTEDPLSDLYEPGSGGSGFPGDTRAALSSVCVSRPYTGGRATDTHPSPETVGRRSGDTPHDQLANGLRSVWSIQPHDDQKASA